LIESACDLFAEKGFTKATNKQICDRAGANIAAVNYYFGSKQNLYAEAWRKAFQDSLKAHPPDGGVPEDAVPEDRLRGRVRAVIRGTADENNKSFLIVHKEMARPTALLDEVMRECMQPLHEETAVLVRELLGPHATERQVRFCMASIMSQCIGATVRMRVHRQHLPIKNSPGILDDIDGYAEHVAQFSLAGIRAIRQQAEKGRTDD